MKKTAWLVLALVGLMVLTPSVVRADRRDDLQAIKKAVKENPAYEPGKEVRWFKILVTDHRSHKETVRITLPIAVFDLFMKCSDDKHFKIDDEHCRNIDFGALLADLKKAGPMSLVEIDDDDETVKIWLE